MTNRMPFKDHIEARTCDKNEKGYPGSSFQNKSLYGATIDKSRFKSKQGMKITHSMFYETGRGKKHNVLYTLKSEDHKGYPSLKKLYLQEEDPTEYVFANKHLYDYDHWLELTECTWFKPHVEKWREELRLILEHRYLGKLMEVAEKGGKEGLQATKILLDRTKKPVAKKKEASGHSWKSRRKEEKDVDYSITTDAVSRLFNGKKHLNAL